MSLLKREGQPGAPRLGGPVHGCQQYAVADGCTPGATVTLMSGGVPMTSACSAGTSQALWAPGGGLAGGDSLSAIQSRCGTLGQPSAPVVVKPVADIPRPAVRGPLYE
ncbi:MAG: hypothetical protein M3024_12290 [Candidatus Dormibacteraeota bacterium]|nr:hypothetical protein [Candidatus Dormibacteraeota bacterium]